MEQLSWTLHPTSARVKSVSFYLTTLFSVLYENLFINFFLSLRVSLCR